MGREGARARQYRRSEQLLQAGERQLRLVFHARGSGKLTPLRLLGSEANSCRSRALPWPPGGGKSAKSRP